VCGQQLFLDQDVLLMERSILNHLGWKLAIPTPLDFLHVFWDTDGEEHCKAPPVIRSMSTYILEIVLPTDISFRYCPSIVAKASMLLAHFALREEHNTGASSFEMLTSMSPFAEVAEAAVSISGAIHQDRVACPQLSVIKRRYEKLQWHAVGKTPIPVLTVRSIAALEHFRQ